ncbi:WW domain [Sesbania bispinosa]|nr:WW domain [Sesbania bispinosa]
MLECLLKINHPNFLNQFNHCPRDLVSNCHSHHRQFHCQFLGQTCQISSESMMPQPDSQAPNGYAPGLGGPGVPLSSSYTFASSSYGQVQTNFSSAGQYQHVPQIQAPVGSSSQSITPGTTPQSNGAQPSVTTVMPSATVQPPLAKVGSSDWIEHTSATGRRFYYNKRTKLSSWEKPFELMTPIESGEKICSISSLYTERVISQAGNDQS